MALSGYYASDLKYGKTNQKVLGKLDEFNGKSLHGLKLKSCGFKVYSEKTKHKKSKGVIRHIVNSQLIYKK